MVLYINEEKVDIVIEFEKNAYEVIQSLAGFLAGESLVISSVEINGNTYSLDDSALKNYEINDSLVINIDAQTRQELVESLLRESKTILNNIVNDIKINSFANSGKFVDLFLWIIETVDLINKNSLFKLVEVRLITSTIQQLIDYLKSDARDENKSESMIGIILNLVEYIEAIELKTSTDFTINKSDLEKAIDEAQELLPDISADFQVGKDKEALNKINKIISVLEFCCLYLKKNLQIFNRNEQDDIDDLYNSMNSMLGEIVEAFENGDVVLIGDLLEYELPEKLEIYKNIILEGK